jgi:predicted alpha/beta hydrolase
MTPIAARRLDGSTLTMIAYAPPDPTGRGPLVIMPAMGVAARFYRDLAQGFAAGGRPVVIGELRGHGDSGVTAGRGVDFGYREMIEEDWPLALLAARRQWPERAPVLLGHSLGGQLSLLYAARHPQAVAAVVTIASCSVHHAGFDGVGALAVWGYVRFARLVADGLGYFPGHRLGFAGREARGVIRDWAAQSATGRYELGGGATDWEALLAAATTPTLIASIDSDRFAPRRAVDNLAAKLVAAPVTRAHWASADLGDPRFDHFTWAKRPAGVIARVEAWLGERGL